MNGLTGGDHTLAVAGSQLHYHVAGTGPVMITHSGGPGVDAGYLRSTALEEQFTMVYPEPLGTGNSGPLPEGATYVDTYVDVLDALISHLGVNSAHLLGHSHGGFVVLRYAIQHPERVAGLVLYSTAPTTTAEFGQATAAAVKAFPQKHPQIPEAAEVAQAFFDEELGAQDATGWLKAIMPLYFADYWGRLEEFEAFRKSVRLWPVSYPSRTIDYRADLGLVTAPTAIVTGRHDFICGPVWARMLHAGIAGSHLDILENSGHFSQIEEPEAFLDSVLRVRQPAADAALIRP